MADDKLKKGNEYIKELFQPSRFYNIPEYQRPYVWSEDQINQLLEDLYEAMKRESQKEYFLGCMIWNTKTSVPDNNNKTYEYQDILDGQQRFITLYLLHAVIRDLSSEDSIKKKVAERLKQEEDKIDGIPEKIRVGFEIRDDQNFLDEFVNTEDGTLKKEELLNYQKRSDSSISTKNMANAIICMHRWWNDIMAKDFEKGQRELLDFFTFLSQKVLVLYLATDDNLDDAYNLFTVLNSRGVQLQTSDILRAQNLRNIPNPADRKNFAKKWSDLENTISKPFNSFDDFLWSLVYIKMKYSSDDNQTLSKGFEHLDKKGLLSKGEDTFRFADTFVKHYDAITNRSIKDDNSGLFFQNLNFILTSVAPASYITPLMFYRECFGNYRILDFLIKLDNLFSLPWLLGKKTSQTRMFILLRHMENIAKMRACSKEQGADEFLKNKVLDYDYDDPNASTVIDIEDFFNMLDKEDWGMYAGTRINKTRYLLLKLDLILSSVDSQLHFDKNKSSVEHLLPRKLNKNHTIQKEIHEKWVHKLGNLVLLDRRKNASLSNKEYSDKKQKYKGAIESRANTNYVFMNNDHWSVDDIKRNHERVKNILKAYYAGNSLETLLSLKHKLSNDQIIEESKLSYSI